MRIDRWSAGAARRAHMISISQIFASPGARKRERERGMEEERKPTTLNRRMDIENVIMLLKSIPYNHTYCRIRRRHLSSSRICLILSKIFVCFASVRCY